MAAAAFFFIGGWGILVSAVLFILGMAYFVNMFAFLGRSSIRCLRRSPARTSWGRSSRRRLSGRRSSFAPITTARRSAISSKSSRGPTPSGRFLPVVFYSSPRSARSSPRRACSPAPALGQAFPRSGSSWPRARFRRARLLVLRPGGLARGVRQSRFEPRLGQAGRARQVRHGAKPEHTRLVFLSVDGEENGQRGSSEFARKHTTELLGLRTFVFNMDTLARLKDLAFLETDTNGLHKLSAPLTAECLEIAAGLGYPVKAVRFPFGGGGPTPGSSRRWGRAVSLHRGLDPPDPQGHRLPHFQGHRGQHRTRGRRSGLEHRHQLRPGQR